MQTYVYMHIYIYKHREGASPKLGVAYNKDDNAWETTPGGGKLLMLARVRGNMYMGM